MTFNKVLITGSCGLVGAEASLYFANLGAQVVGIDNNSRKKWFGHGGDTSPVRKTLEKLSRYEHLDIDLTQERFLPALLEQTEPDLVIHCAGQPSHEKSAEIPLEDFQINALATVKLLDAVRISCPKTPFVFTSTNKVYGDGPNFLRTKESNLRIDFFDHRLGVTEDMSLDCVTHSPFGASKVAADIMVQEYGLYYGMNTVCFRCGCITGSKHRGVEQHGFLSYLCKTAKEGKVYTIYGHDGKQVRDNIHAYDLVLAFHAWAERPCPGSVYNIGGGVENSCSILEAIEKIREITGIEVKTNFGPARKGDHCCYYSDMTAFKRDYSWHITRDLKSIMTELLVDA